MSLALLQTNTGTSSVRQRELDTGRLVLLAAQDRDAFMIRRAGSAVHELESSPARRALMRASAALLDGDPDEVTSGLLAYGTVLERHGEHEGAAEVYRVVLGARPNDIVAALHAARAARKAGRRGEALELYRRAAVTAEAGSHLSLMVRIGEALVSDRPVEALTAAIRAARRAGDFEAVAVSREERSRLLLAAGRTGAALRDLGAAAARYPARVDRIRVLHRMAEILGARGDLPAAREALFCALEHVDDRHRSHTVQRLRTIARAMGDELELRRTRGQASAALVTLTPVRQRVRAEPSRLAQMQRLRDLLPSARC